MSKSPTSHLKNKKVLTKRGRGRYNEHMLKIEYIDVAKLKPYDKNTRKHEDYDVAQADYKIFER